MEKFMPKSTGQLGLTNDSSPNKVNLAVKHRSGCLDGVIREDVNDSINDFNGGFTSKLFDKFIYFLRNLAD